MKTGNVTFVNGSIKEYVNVTDATVEEGCLVLVLNDGTNFVLPLTSIVEAEISSQKEES